MRTKKLFALLLALCLALALAACGGAPDVPAEVTPKAASPAPEIAATPEAAPSPEQTPEASPEPDAVQTPEPEPDVEEEPEDERWEPDWSLLDFTAVEGAARYIRERCDSTWRNDYGDRTVFHSETLTAYDGEDRVLFERLVDSDGYASEYVYAYGVLCFEYDYDTYIDSVRFRSNQGDDTLTEDVYDAVTDVRFRTELSGTEGLSRIEYAYDTNGNIIQELTVVPTEEEAFPVCVRNYTYDSWDGWLIREVYEDGAGAGMKIVTEYEHEDDRLCAELTTLTDYEGETHVTETKYFYDERGNLAAQETVSDEGSERWEFEYVPGTDELSRTVFVGLTSYEERYAYTDWGALLNTDTTYHNDPERDSVECEYDAQRRLVRRTETYDYGASRETRVTTRSYEPA